MAKQQDEFPMEGEGVERKVIKPLEDAIADWNDVKAKRMKLTEKEVLAKAAVLTLMHKHELTTYQYDDDHKVVVKDGVKVERLKKAGEDDEE